jgi:hypothetical protein
MDIFAIFLCDFSGVYMCWVCFVPVVFNDEIFGGFSGVLSGFLQIK